MTADQLRADIDTMLLDIEFMYNGIGGAICPFSRNNIAVAFGDEERIFASIDEMMDEPFIDGKPMKDICTQFEF